MTLITLLCNSTLPKRWKKLVTCLRSFMGKWKTGVLGSWFTATLTTPHWRLKYKAHLQPRFIFVVCEILKLSEQPMIFKCK